MVTEIWCFYTYSFSGRATEQNPGETCIMEFETKMASKPSDGKINSDWSTGAFTCEILKGLGSLFFVWWMQDGNGGEKAGRHYSFCGLERSVSMWLHSSTMPIGDCNGLGVRTPYCAGPLRWRYDSYYIRSFWNNFWFTGRQSGRE